MGFVKFRINNQEFKNGALYDLFEGGYKALLNPMEARIVKLYSLLDKGIMPWHWDYENYSDITMFYPEDINAILQIRELEVAGELRRSQEQSRK